MEWIDELPEDETINENPFSGYWATDDKIGANIIDKVRAFNDEIVNRGIDNRWKTKYDFYHGEFNGSPFGMGKMGDDGQYMFFSQNLFRSIAQTIIATAIQTEPSFQVKSSVNDSTSIQVAKLAENVLDYYMRSRRVKDNLQRAVEHALIYDAGYVLVEYDPFAGDKTGADEFGKMISEGDLRITNPHSHDVIFDPFKKSFNDCDWVIIREFVNRYDLIGRHLDDSELVEKIKGASQFDEITKLYSDWSYSRNSSLNDDIAIYKFFHRSTEALPDGRYTKILCDGTVLEDNPFLHYPRLPIERIIANEELGTPFGFSPLNSIVGSQKAMNILNSAILTNQYANAVNLVAINRGTDMNISELSTGLSVVYYEAGQQPPQAISLVKTAPEVFAFRQTIENEMQTLTGISGVSMGQTKSGASGQGNALMASLSAQNQAGLSDGFAELCANVGTLMIQILRSNASERTVAITGERNGKIFFSGTDLDGVERVVAELGNSQARTTAGRIQMASELLRAGVIGPEEYGNVLQTGRIDKSFDKLKEHDWVYTENEKLLSGQQILVHPSDNHELHSSLHRMELFREEIRIPQTQQDILAAKTLMDHMAEHDAMLARSQAMSMPLPPPPPEPDGSIQPPGNVPAPSPDGGPGGAPPAENGAEQATDKVGISIPEPSTPPQI